MEGYNEDYLNGLIAKAKKSWEGVAVDNYMKNVMGIYDRWSGEKYYKTFENYLDKIIAPYLKTRNINIGDLKDETNRC